MKFKLFTLLLAISTPIYSIAKETLEFSCITKNHDKITIHSTNDKGYYIYRFYKNGKLQLKIKQDKKTIYQQTMKQNPIHRIEANTMTFANGKYLYTVSDVFTFKTFKKDGYTIIGKIINEEAGVDIEKNDLSSITKEIKCKSIQKSLPDDHLILN
jgi:hypothetical protein